MAYGNNLVFLNIYIYVMCFIANMATVVSPVNKLWLMQIAILDTQTLIFL